MKTNVKKEERCLNVGVLGCGIICQAAHLIGSTKARNVHLYAICDVAEDLLNKMAAIYDPDVVYNDYSRMLADPKVEAVIIGIGDQFHVPCAKQAILAGKHVLLEKPMGVSLEECQELKLLAEEKGLVLQIGHMKRFDEGLQFAKNFKEEKMGQVEEREREVDALNAEIAEKLYPLDSLTLGDLKTVEELMARYEALCAEERAFVKNSGDLERALTRLTGLRRSVFIGIGAGAGVLLLGILAFWGIRRRLTGKKREMEQLSALFREEEEK